MSVLLKRWLIYFLIPAGLVLLLFPLNTHRSEMIDKDFVFMGITETLVDKATEAVKPIPPENPEREDILQFIEEQQKFLSKEISTVTTVINPHGYPVIQKQDLMSYPILVKEIEAMMQKISDMRLKRSIGKKQLDDVPLDEWQAFSNAFLGGTEIAYFQYGNSVFKGQIKSTYDSTKVEVEGLKIVLKVVGGFLLLISFFTFYGLYTPSSNGIQIGPCFWMIVWDVIVIAIGVFFMSGFLDSMLVKYFQVVHFWGDEKMAFIMGLLWVFFGNLIMAIFITATAFQNIWITQKGIILKSLSGTQSLAWDDVKNIHLKEVFILRTVFRVLAPRKVAKILVIQGSAFSMQIMEPPMSSTKKEILNELNVNAPEILKGKISSVSKEWLSIW